MLSAVDRVVQQARVQATVSFGFADEQPLRHWCEGHEGRIEHITYSSQVTATVSVPETEQQALADFCEAHRMDYRFDT